MVLPYGEVVMWCHAKCKSFYNTYLSQNSSHTIYYKSPLQKHIFNNIKPTPKIFVLMCVSNWKFHGNDNHTPTDISISVALSIEVSVIYHSLPDLYYILLLKHVRLYYVY